MKPTFKAFLVEQRRTRVINKEEFENFVHMNCPKYLDNMRKNKYLSGIYRGVKTEDPYFYGDSSQHVRKSANTWNYYTLLLDHILPNWTNYPNRSQSFICTTYRHTAGRFGNTYIVFPKDGTKVGICPRNDFWDSFEIVNTLFKTIDMANFNRIFNSLFLRIFGVHVSDDDPKEFKDNLKELDAAIKNAINAAGSEEKFINEIKTKYKLSNSPTILFLQELLKYNSIVDMLTHVLDPNKNGFETEVSQRIPIEYKEDNQEVWFAGPAVFASIKDFEGIE